MCFGEGGEEGYLPGSQPPPRYWLEGTKPLPINQEEGEEWELYQRMLKGDFSLVDDERWGALQWEYEDALEEGNGKCNWDYFLMDFDQDGSREMVIRLSKVPFFTRTPRSYPSRADSTRPPVLWLVTEVMTYSPRGYSSPSTRR